MKYVLAIILGLICLAPTSVEAGIFGRRCNSCYSYAYVPQNILIEQETIIIPRRITRYNEIPGLQILEDEHGHQLLVINGKIINYNGATVARVDEEINERGEVERVRKTQVDSYGIRIISEDRVIRH